MIASLLFSSVVLYGAWHQSENRRFLHETQALYLAQAALVEAQVRLSESDGIWLERGSILTDSLETGQHWAASISPWGFYWRTIATGTSQQVTHRIDALLGRKPSAAFDYAVRLFGPPYPLVVAGQTKIIGDVNTGPGGVASGEYQGRGRIDTILVNGEIVYDPLPRFIPIDWGVWNTFRERSDSLRNGSPVYTDRALIIDDSWNSFDSDSIVVVDEQVEIKRTTCLVPHGTMTIFASGPISISGGTRLDARWVLQSDQMIELSDSVRVAGVVLCAPRIKIAGDASFSGQAIADTLIEVAGHAQTVFPTLLWVTGSETGSGTPLLQLESRKICEGIAGLSFTSGPWDWMLGAEYGGKLGLAPNAHWKGYIYANGKAEIRGVVAGAINAELLVLDDPPTTYLNWLLDATINRTDWQGSAVLPAIFGDSDTWNVAELIDLGSRAAKPKLKTKLGDDL